MVLLFCYLVKTLLDSLLSSCKKSEKDSFFATKKIKKYKNYFKKIKNLLPYVLGLIVAQG